MLRDSRALTTAESRANIWPGPQMIATSVPSMLACADPDFFQRGSNFDYVFLVDERREDPNTTKSGPSSARQRNAIYMVFRWRADGGPTVNAGLVALWFYRASGPVLLRNPIFCNFSGGGGLVPCPPTSGSANGR